MEGLNVDGILHSMAIEMIRPATPGWAQRFLTRQAVMICGDAVVIARPESTPSPFSSSTFDAPILPCHAQASQAFQGQGGPRLVECVTEDMLSFLPLCGHKLGIQSMKEEGFHKL